MDAHVAAHTEMETIWQAHSGRGLLILATLSYVNMHKAR